MSLLQHSVIESGGYNIDRSLRFRSSASAYLDRTLTTPTNNKIYTWSGWVKKSVIGTTARKVLFSARNGTSEDYLAFDDTADNLRFFIGSQNYATSSALYRDPSAWYHAFLSVDTTQATAANRIRLYINGNLVADGNSGNAVIPQNTVTTMNGAYRHIHGRNDYNTAWYFDGYLAEVNFIDGQALTPSSFGSTNPVTGVWQPAKYTGTYGTNGFYLPFSDNTSATTLAYDKSGNSNNWTANNISTTAGATYDSMTDVPTLTSATAANYCVPNPLNTTSGVLSSGNLDFTYSSGSASGKASIGVTSGKWYFETTMTAANINMAIGWANDSGSIYADVYKSTVGGYHTIENSSGSASGSWDISNGQVLGVAFDYDAGTMYFYTNNSLAITLTGFSTGSQVLFPKFGIASGGGGATTYSINFGQRPFSYTPPTGFKALNTFNLH